MLKLKTTILPSEEPPDKAKNEERYAELIQFLDNKGLSLVMRDAADDSRKALKILRAHYASQSNPRIITLYTELTSLEMGTNETVTGYLIRTEKAIMALRNAKETLSDGLIKAMILKGLPESYKPLAIHVTKSTSEITFTEFKVQLRSFEETEKFNTKVKVKIELGFRKLTCFYYTCCCFPALKNLKSHVLFLFFIHTRLARNFTGLKTTSCLKKWRGRLRNAHDNQLGVIRSDVSVSATSSSPDHDQPRVSSTSPAHATLTTARTSTSNETCIANILSLQPLVTKRYKGYGYVAIDDHEGPADNLSCETPATINGKSQCKRVPKKSLDFFYA